MSGISYRSLSGYVKSLINGGYPDIGQVHYVVDSDYRTAAQGWSRADGTGPLDLWGERHPGYVFYGAGSSSGTGVGNQYARDQLAIQAAIDAMVDFRGDTLFFTPGSYSIGTTALAMNVANARYLGPPVAHPRRAAVTITDAIGDNSISVDDVEVGFLKFIPLTAQNTLDLASGADRGYIHDCHWDATGIATSTSTEFVNGTTNADWLIRNVAHTIDDEQGDAYTLTSSVRWLWENCDFYVSLTGVAWATVFTFTTSALGNVVRDCLFRGCGGSTPAVFTNIFTGATNVNGQLMVYKCFIDGTALTTASAIETGFGTATDIEIAECYQTGDATGEGGVAIALA